MSRRITVERFSNIDVNELTLGAFARPLESPFWGFGRAAIS